MSKKLYIGLMSGTSLDGVDVALCSIDDRSCTLEASLFIPMSELLKDEILSVINGTTTLKQIGEIDHKLALFFAKGVTQLLKDTQLNHNEIVAIGSHGQTLWHEPNGEYPFSMQLGNPSLLASLTDIDVIADFRSKDVAMGGQGAPFAPAFHAFLFSELESCAVLNIGGMANISILGKELIGYDTGCGNVLMDLWTQEHKSIPYDKDGSWAKSGKVHDKLLEAMLNDSYFNLNFPKSTGREYFNKKFLIKYLEPFGKICSADVEATLLALTVESIANEIRKFKIIRLLVCGGGVRNLFLMSELQRVLPLVDVGSTQEYDVSSDNIEAMIFAWFAHKRLAEEPIELMSVTGAKNNTILGGIYATN
jgi:anhydro-N-acetylmuramic acid kinase